MTRTRLVSVAAGILGSTVAAVMQTSSPGALSPALRTHLQAERFQIVTSVRGFPLGVRDRLQTLFTGGLDIADPGADFQKTATPVNPPLPIRRLIVGGCALDHHCLVYYERGGGTVTRRAALFQWSPAETKFEFGGMAPAGLATIDDVRKAMLSGAIKGGQAEPW